MRVTLFRTKSIATHYKKLPDVVSTAKSKGMHCDLNREATSDNHKRLLDAGMTNTPPQTLLQEQLTVSYRYSPGAYRYWSRLMPCASRTDRLRLSHVGRALDADLDHGDISNCLHGSAYRSYGFPHKASNR